MGVGLIEPKDENKYTYKDEDVAVLKCEIAMGSKAFIAYSYSLSASSILNMVAQNIQSFGGDRYHAVLDNGRVIIDGVDSYWNYKLIENTDKNFAAVVFYLVIIWSGEETEQEKEVYAHYMAVFEVQLKEYTKINGVVIESIEIPNKTQAFEDNGFIFGNDKLVDIFRNSILLKTPDKISTTASRYENTMNYNKSSGGCYIATAVYGSYDCPEVWTFRRYRDENLSSTILGRTFIKTYYALSPTVVRLFGNTEWFNKFWRGRLDKIAENLRKKGYKDTPYIDKRNE